MGILFKDALHERLGTWPLGYIPYGGPDYGEIEAVARAVADGDDDSFHAAWTAAGERFAVAAEAALAKGHRASAHELLLRAACCHGKSYHPLYGLPLDPRLATSYRLQIALFERAMALGDDPVLPLRIPFEGTAMPGYLVPAVGRATEVRPLLICTNGYDGQITDLYFASAVAAARRGYHCLIFDGPGQGRMLIEQGMALRPDWEHVLGAVIDFALTLPQVDPSRIALNGWSLGGYLAPRAASGEHRLAACIADPGQADLADGLRAFAVKLGASPEAMAASSLGDLDSVLVDRMEAIIDQDRVLRWSVKQRGFWMNGVASLREYLREVERFSMKGRTERIRCPTLFTLAEGDPLAAGTQAFFEQLRCPRQLLRFTREEGADGHCEMLSRSLVNRRSLDWLDEVLRPSQQSICR